MCSVFIRIHNHVRRGYDAVCPTLVGNNFRSSEALNDDIDFYHLLTLYTSYILFIHSFYNTLHNIYIYIYITIILNNLWVLALRLPLGDCKMLSSLGIGASTRPNNDFIYAYQ